MWGASTVCVGRGGRVNAVVEDWLRAEIMGGGRVPREGLSSVRRLEEKANS